MMASITSLLNNAMSFGSRDSVGESEDESQTTEASASQYLPSVPDVMVVKAMLLKSIQLPIEIVDLVLDYAEYWPHTTAYVKPGAARNTPLATYGGSNENDNRFLVGYLSTTLS